MVNRFLKRCRYGSSPSICDNLDETHNNVDQGGSNLHWRRKILALAGIIVLVLLTNVLLGGCTQEEEIEELAVGDTAPDFMIKDTEGNIVILSKFEGDPVVLRFFETDCRFCRADTPIINVYFDKYKDKGLHVFYIAAYHEKTQAVEDFIEALDVSFPIIMDTGAKLADQYNVILYPQTIMVSPERKVLAIIPGGVGEAELDELVGPYLDKQPSA